jgi:hypothetical protein
MQRHAYERHHPRRRMSQYSTTLRSFWDDSDYRIPAFAGMTAGF